MNKSEQVRATCPSCGRSVLVMALIYRQAWCFGQGDQAHTSRPMRTEP